MAVNIGGLIAILVSYVVILVIGIYAGKKRGKGVEEMLLAGRKLGGFIGLCTMTATWVGGGYVSGSAEAVFNPSGGIIYAFSMWSGPLSLLLNAWQFVPKMRKKKYYTMLDPFQEKYGSRMTGLLFIPVAVSDIFWAGAIFYALGTTFGLVVGVSNETAVIVSAAVTVVYSVFGGLYSVAYTDVIQLAFMFIGLWVSLPFAVTNPAVSNIVENSDKWVGKWSTENRVLWIDLGLMAILGSIPWQEYYQRVLACRSTKEARLLTVGAAGLGYFFAVPSLLLGAAGACTDWSKTSYDQPSINGTLVPVENPMALPMALQYLTPTAVSFIGLGAVSAAVMSSSDSILLSSSSMFAHNVYKLAFRQTASEREIVWVMRVTVVVTGVISVVVALAVKSVIFLVILCMDLVYVIVFPQLFCVLFFENSNTYGALVGYIVGLVLRLTAGDPSLGIPSLIQYPYYSVENGQIFPYRSLAMLLGLVLTIGLSYFTKYLFENEIVPLKMDIFHCFQPEEPSEDVTDNKRKSSLDKGRNSTYESAL